MSEGRYDPNQPGGQASDDHGQGSGSTWSSSTGETGATSEAGSTERSGGWSEPATPPGSGASSAPGELAGLVNQQGASAQGQQPVGADQVQPPAGWTPAAGSPGAPPPAAEAKKGRSQLVQWVGAGAVLAVIVILALVFRDRLSGNVGNLQVGDCFDEPAGTGEVSDIQHQPCTEPHDAEVIFVGDFADQDAYPGDTAFEEFAGQQCVTSYEAYIGRDYETDTEFDYNFFYPTRSGWADGDHEVTCHIYRVDGEKMTASVKAA
jgi:hypothetical protein